MIAIFDCLFRGARAAFLPLALCVVIGHSQAATVNATSVSYTDVSSAVSRAANGDVVTVPAGTANWSTSLSISKAITLQGAGIGRTIIQDSVSGSSIDSIIVWTLVPNRNSRMTGIEFQATSHVPARSRIMLSGRNDDGSRIRVDHCKFTNLKAFNIEINGAIGLIDHNTFNYLSIPIYVYHANFNDHTSSQPFGDYSVVAPIGWGTDQFMFVEDNTFSYQAAGTNPYAIIDSYRGARYVVRYNTITRGWCEAHGVEAASRYRGTRGGEIYNNKFIGAGTGFTGITNLRSGTWVVHDNTAANIPATVIRLVNHRSATGINPDWKGMDGTNPWDINDPKNPYYSGTVSSPGLRTVTVSGSPWTTDQWKGCEIKRDTTNALAIKSISSGNPAVITTAVPHGLTTGNYVRIDGSNSSPSVNGALQSVTVVSATQFSLPYNVTSAGTAGTVTGEDFSEILGNTGNTITFTTGYFAQRGDLYIPSGATFKINKVIQGMDQVGRGQGSLITGVEPPTRPSTWNDQKTEPCYEWNNTTTLGAAFHFSAENAIIRNGEHYFNSTQAPGYRPYTYPHPLIAATENQLLPPSDLRIGP